jgi:hypothetical protein
VENRSFTSYKIDHSTGWYVVIPRPTRRKCHSDVFSVATAAVHAGRSVTFLVNTQAGGDSGRGHSLVRRRHGQVGIEWLVQQWGRRVWSGFDEG